MNTKDAKAEKSETKKKSAPKESAGRSSGGAKGRASAEGRDAEGREDIVLPAVPRLKLLYETEIKPNLLKEYSYSNVMRIPRVTKIVLNMGVGDAVNDRKILSNAMEQMTLIAGQKPIMTRARTSISSFKIREGFPIGCKVTLRGPRMYEFLDRLVNIALPRVRDFRGISPKNFDRRGNFAFGLREQIVFPEISFDQVDRIRGLDVVICTTAQTDREALSLLKGFNLPFIEQKDSRK